MTEIRILGIDPGPVQSSAVEASCTTDGTFTVLRLYRDMTNGAMLDAIEALADRPRGLQDPRMAIEWLTNYGGPVGDVTFDTARWVGRFEQVADQNGIQFHLIQHPSVSWAICGRRDAKDPQLHQAIKDRFGRDDREAKGLKAAPGPLYGIADHLWDALAVALTYADHNVVAPPGTAGRAGRQC